MNALSTEQYDCMVLDLGLPDMTGFELMERIRKDAALCDLPIIIYTGKELTRRQETELRRFYSRYDHCREDVKSPERLVG